MDSNLLVTHKDGIMNTETDCDILLINCDEMCDQGHAHKH